MVHIGRQSLGVPIMRMRLCLVLIIVMVECIFAIVIPKNMVFRCVLFIINDPASTFFLKYLISIPILTGR